MKTLLTALILLLFTSCCADRPPPVEALKAFVEVSGKGSVYAEDSGVLPVWRGSGAVVRVTRDEDNVPTVWVLTAKHVVDDPDFVYFVRMYNGKEVRPTYYEAQVWKLSETRDLAVLKVEKVNPFGVVNIAEYEPKRFDPVWTVGQTPAGVVIPNEGVITGWIRAQPDGWVNSYSETVGDMFVNAHIRPGYSGGPCFVWEDGEWRLGGVNVMVSVYGYQHAADQAWIEPAVEVRRFLYGLGW